MKITSCLSVGNCLKIIVQYTMKWPSLVAQWLRIHLQCRSCRRHRFNPWSGRSPEGGHGSPLQYSCLENPMDRGAWWATVHRVIKSWIQLKWLSMHAHHEILSSVLENKNRNKLPELLRINVGNGPVYLMEKTNSEVFLVRSQNTFLMNRKVCVYIHRSVNKGYLWAVRFFGGEAELETWWRELFMFCFKF